MKRQKNRLKCRYTKNKNVRIDYLKGSSGNTKTEIQ